jgi:hypothetical protein
VAGELCVALEAADRADLAQQLGGAQGATAGQREELRSDGLDPLLELLVERVDRPRQLAAAVDELERDPHLHRLLATAEPAVDPVEPERPVKRPQRHRDGQVELVQVPTQPLLTAAPLGDEVVAVIDEQLQLPQQPLPWSRRVQPRLTEGCPRDRDRVDPVRLATTAAAPPLRR